MGKWGSHKPARINVSGLTQDFAHLTGIRLSVSEHRIFKLYRQALKALHIIGFYAGGMVWFIGV